LRHVLAVLAVTLSMSLTAQAAQIDGAAEPAIVIGSDGLGLVAYQDRASLDLKVAHCLDADCTAATSVTVDSAGDVGARAAIAVRPGGLPVVAYEDATNHTIKLALCQDALCATASTLAIGPVTTTTPTTASGHVGLAIGADGRPIVAYSAGTLTEGGTTSVLRVVHCNDAACTATTSSNHGTADYEVSLAIAGDGRAVIVYWTVYPNGSDTWFRHCNDLACTSSPNPDVRADRRHDEPTIVYESNPSLAIAPDGLPLYAYSPFGRTLIRCQTYDCATFTTHYMPGGGGGPTAMATDASGRPRFATGFFNEIGMANCDDSACTTFQTQCVAPWASLPSMALDGAAQPLVAVQVASRVDVLRPGSCQPTSQGGDDVYVYEGNPPNAGSMPFTIRLHPPAAFPVTVAYSTVDVTAQAGSDYVGASGILTFAPGEVMKQVVTQTIPDTLFEPNETFDLLLTSTGTPVARDRMLGFIGNDDAAPMPRVFVDDCAVVEGNTGTTPCHLDVRLSFAPVSTVTVGYATSDGTAAANADYIQQSGTLTFAPGMTSQTISVGVVGDLVGEADEFFNVGLFNLGNGLPGDLSATGSIVDDDWPVLPGLELTHAAAIVGDFQPDPGPVPDRDDYRIAQAPFSSYEAVLDAVSGDAAPGARLEHVAADGVTVLDVADPVGTGTAVAVRFANPLELPVTNQYLRVSAASCGTACGADDTYRLRVYETTGRIPRFNNSGSQTTVLILQNTTDRPVLADATFWSPAGERLATQSLLIAARGTSVTSTVTIPGLETGAGSVTILHYGPYGALAGKAVALEPATGFSFDSPMELRPR
jgi:Calx-beta domain